MGVIVAQFCKLVGFKALLCVKRLQVKGMAAALTVEYHRSGGSHALGSQPYWRTEDRRSLHCADHYIGLRSWVVAGYKTV
jgi:hypothetical protein